MEAARGAAGLLPPLLLLLLLANLTPITPLPASRSPTTGAPIVEQLPVGTELCAAEGETCTCTGDVFVGAPVHTPGAASAGGFVRHPFAGSVSQEVQCSNPDTAEQSSLRNLGPRSRLACFCKRVQITDRLPPAAVRCAEEKQGYCSCQGFIYFGVPRRWHRSPSWPLALRFTSATPTAAVPAVSAVSAVSCTTSHLGGDPAPGTAKQCHCLEWPSPSAASAAVGVSVSGDLHDLSRRPPAVAAAPGDMAAGNHVPSMCSAGGGKARFTWKGRMYKDYTPLNYTMHGLFDLILANLSRIPQLIATVTLRPPCDNGIPVPRLIGC